MAIEENQAELGRLAKKPHQLPKKAWKSILKRVRDDFQKNNMSLISAGIAFYELLALFPLLISIVSIYSIFADPATVEDQLNSASQFIPPDAQSIISNQLNNIVTQSSTTLSVGTMISILAALWSANKGSKALMDGFNIAYDEVEARGFIKKNLVALSFTFSAVVSIIIALALIALLPAILSVLRIDTIVTFAVSWGRWVVLAFMMIIGLAILNRFAPSRNDAKWSWVSVGSIFSTILLLLLSAGFSFYVSNFGKYNETYGSIGGVIVLLLWLYFSTYIVLLGAELNAESEFQTAQDTTIGKEKPMGQRGAVKADNLPKTG